MAATAEVTYTPPQTASAATLGTIVELVRRITRADVTSIVSFSLDEKTITWKATSGFRALPHDQPLVRSIANAVARRALDADSMTILEGIGTRSDSSGDDFPVHRAEGVRDLAVVPLKARGHTLGALLAGYRSAHHFNKDEKQQLQDLAEMAALVLDNARLAESVSAAETIWEQTFDAIGEGIIVHDADMQVIRCNARAVEVLDTEASTLIGVSFRDVFRQLFGKRAADYYLADYRGAATVFEVQTEGDRRYLVSVSPLQRTDGSSVSVVTWNDVTRLTEVQEQLARTRRLASVGQLAAGVAHEINNPLAAITTCAEATLRDLRQAPEIQQLGESHQWTYYLEEIVRQSLRCKEITRGLLDLTRQRQAQRTLCDVNMIAKQCAKVGLQRNVANTVEFEINLDENIGQIATDAAMIRQVLDNLLSNAIDALGEVGGKVSVSTISDADRIAIEVADTGPGIPPQIVAKIFDPFFSTKGPGKGYGLGLAICSTLAESLDGAITVETKEGEGSRFRLWLPRRAPEQKTL